MSEQRLGGAGWAADVGEAADDIRMVLAAMDDRRFMERLWAKEPDLWKPAGADQSEIADRLGWLDVAAEMRGQVGALRAFAAKARADGLRQVLLLGMGGSSLGPEVLGATFGTAPDGLDLRVLDSTSPDAVRAAQAWLDPAHTLFLVSSKSGGTIEVMSFYRYFRDLLNTQLGERAGQHFAAITDPGTALERLAQAEGFRHVFLNRPDIGGRYSVLSLFGLVPAALLGIDVARLLDQALAMQRACGPATPAGDNPGAALGVIMAESAKRGRDKLTLIPAADLISFGAWVEQLIAESTGKEGTGILPVDGEPIGLPDDYGDDRLFVQLRLGDDTSQDDALERLIAVGHPVVRLQVDDAYDLGAEFYRWEMATAVAGALLGINAFDQPNVQESKDFTDRILRDYQRERRLPEAPQVGVGDELVPALERLLGTVGRGGYIALNAFLPTTLTTEAALATIRALLRNRYQVATTAGYGPRFLHSTGQFHKGGPPTGIFIQLTAEPGTDLPIPGQPYTFGVLLAAQALGDYEALARRNRRVLRVRLPADVGAGLRELEAAVRTVIGTP